MTLRDFAHRHVEEFTAGLFCLWLSLCLILRLWLVHRNDSFFKKLLWSLVLGVPFLGWLSYGAFYTRLGENEVKASVNPDALSGGS